MYLYIYEERDGGDRTRERGINKDIYLYLSLLNFFVSFVDPPLNEYTPTHINSY